MDRDDEGLHSGHVSVALRGRQSSNRHCPQIWIVERCREVRRDLVGILVAWVAITLVTLAIGRLLFQGW